MIESFIIALREGVEVALVIGILIVYLRKIDQQQLVSTVFAALIAAVAVSMAAAYLLRRFAVDHELLEGYLMLTAAVFVISMVVWMWMTAKRIRTEIQERVDTIVRQESSWNARLGIFAFTFLMTVREGIETAIFLQAVSLNTESWLAATGTLAGISSAVVFGFLFVRGSVRIDIGRFLRVTAIVLLIFTVQLIVNALHEFYEFGVFPANPRAMALLGPIVQHDMLFVLALLSIPALMLIIPGKKRGADGNTQATRRWQLSAGVATLCLVFFLGMGEVYSSDPTKDLSAIPLDVPGTGLVSIPLTDVDDGNVHRYSIRDGKLEIRFFVLRTSLATFATAFDACYACYSHGRYFLRKGELICSLCDAPSPLSKLRPSFTAEEPDSEHSGSMDGNGCAPIYLPSRIQDGQIVVTLADLQSKRKYFDVTDD
jgi:high-affinity iron transporter